MVAKKKPSSPRTSKKPSKPVVSSSQNSSIVKIVIITLLVGFIMFWAYAWLANGSVQGYIAEHQAFPDPHGQMLTAKRQKVLDEISHMDSLYGPNSKLGAVQVTTLRYIDSCQKGSHDTGLSVEPTNDSWAYECGIGTVKYYVYNQSVCEIAAAVAAQKISFTVSADCTSTIPELGGGNIPYYYSAPKEDPNANGPSISIDSRDTFINDTRAELLSEFSRYKIGCDSNKGPRPVVYCNNLSPTIETSNNALDKIPAAAQTVLKLETGGDYYGGYYNK